MFVISYYFDVVAIWYRGNTKVVRRGQQARGSNKKQNEASGNVRNLQEVSGSNRKLQEASGRHNNKIIINKQTKYSDSTATSRL